jgi:hypothetical protein
MSSEQDNRMVWDGRAGHYEVWYATLSHRASGTGFWIRYTLEAPRLGDGEPYAQLWFARFDPGDPTATFGINHRLPASQLAASAPPFSLSIGDATLRHDGMRGALAGGGHEVSWDLRWRPSPSTYHHLPELIYRTDRVDTKVVSPNLDVAIDGEIVVDGKRYELAGDPGGQTHLWGRKHAYQWAWSHCNGFDGQAPDRERGAVFESISVRLKRGAVLLPRLTLFTLYLEGEEFAFREFWKLPLARSDFATGNYHLIGMTPESRVEARFTCRAEDMVLAEYVDPDGDPAFCHNTCAADAVVTVKRRSPFVGRFRDWRTLTSRRMAHFEWGGRAGDVVNVKKVHRAV